MHPTKRKFSMLDRCLMGIDQAVQTIFSKPASTRAHPAKGIEQPALDEKQRQHVAGLIRVDHAGEVCAQALYQGQALSAKDPKVQAKMHQSAEEENDHLAWCWERLEELGSHTSHLNPLFYGGSFMIGAVAGLIGDKWSLGFVAETEAQVVKHLEAHIQQLPKQDSKSRAILEQMRADEAHHATTAIEAGGADLPKPVQSLMNMVSKAMTQTAYWL